MIKVSRKDEDAQHGYPYIGWDGAAEVLVLFSSPNTGAMLGESCKYRIDWSEELFIRYHGPVTLSNRA